MLLTPGELSSKQGRLATDEAFSMEIVTVIFIL